MWALRNMNVSGFLNGDATCSFIELKQSSKFERLIDRKLVMLRLFRLNPQIKFEFL